MEVSEGLWPQRCKGKSVKLFTAVVHYNLYITVHTCFILKMTVIYVHLSIYVFTFSINLISILKYNFQTNSFRKWKGFEFCFCILTSRSGDMWWATVDSIFAMVSGTLWLTAQWLSTYCLLFLYNIKIVSFEFISFLWD